MTHVYIENDFVIENDKISAESSEGWFVESFSHHVGYEPDADLIALWNKEGVVDGEFEGLYREWSRG